MRPWLVVLRQSDREREREREREGGCEQVGDSDDLDPFQGASYPHSGHDLETPPFETQIDARLSKTMSRSGGIGPYTPSMRRWDNGAYADEDDECHNHRILPLRACATVSVVLVGLLLSREIVLGMFLAPADQPLVAGAAPLAIPLHPSSWPIDMVATVSVGAYYKNTLLPRWIRGLRRKAQWRGPVVIGCTNCR